MELLTQAGIDVVTLNVFNWASLQPSEETYDFAELDAAVKRVTEQDGHLHGHLYRSPPGVDGQTVSRGPENGF